LTRSAADADWSHEIRYHILLRQPEVRALIAHHAALAAKPMTMEEFIAGSVGAMGVTGDLAAVASIFTYRLGRYMTTSPTTQTEVIPVAPAYVMVAVLCSLAQRGHTLLEAQQADDGCLFHAALRRTITSAGGDLAVSVLRRDTSSVVEATVQLRGAKFDLKSKYKRRHLDQLFADLRTIPLAFVPPRS
jgi:hypothetical protein